MHVLVFSSACFYFSIHYRPSPALPLIYFLLLFLYKFLLSFQSSSNFQKILSLSFHFYTFQFISFLNLILNLHSLFIHLFKTILYSVFDIHNNSILCSVFTISRCFVCVFFVILFSFIILLSFFKFPFSVLLSVLNFPKYYLMLFSFHHHASQIYLSSFFLSIFLFSLWNSQT